MTFPRVNSVFNFDPACAREFGVKNEKGIIFFRKHETPINHYNGPAKNETYYTWANALMKPKYFELSKDEILDVE